LVFIDIKMAGSWHNATIWETK